MAAPIVVVGVGNTAASGNATASIATPASTQVGDLIILEVYLEPANEGTASANYGTVTFPAAFNLVTGFPVNTDDANLTTVNATSRLYAFWAYATVAGAQTITVSFSLSGVFCGLTCTIVRGGPTSGNPFSEIITASSSSVAPGNGPPQTTPQVALTLGGPDSLVLWLISVWNGAMPAGEPTGFSVVAAPSNQDSVPHISQRTFTSPGSTGTVSTSSNNNTQGGMNAALLSIRSASTPPALGGYPGKAWVNGAEADGYWTIWDGSQDISSISAGV